MSATCGTKRKGTEMFKEKVDPQIEALLDEIRGLRSQLREARSERDEARDKVKLEAKLTAA